MDCNVKFLPEIETVCPKLLAKHASEIAISKKVNFIPGKILTPARKRPFLKHPDTGRPDLKIILGILLGSLVDN